MHFWFFEKWVGIKSRSQSSPLHTGMFRLSQHVPPMFWNTLWKSACRSNLRAFIWQQFWIFKYDCSSNFQSGTLSFPCQFCTVTFQELRPTGLYGVQNFKTFFRENMYHGFVVSAGICPFTSSIPPVQSVTKQLLLQKLHPQFVENALLRISLPSCFQLLPGALILFEQVFKFDYTIMICAIQTHFCVMYFLNRSQIWTPNPDPVSTIRDLKNSSK